MNRLPSPSPRAPGAARASTWLQPKCSCGTGAGGVSGRCPACARQQALGLQTQLAVSTPGDRFEQEADQAAARVLAGSGRPTLTPLAAPPLQREGEDDKKKEPPGPIGEGLATVGKNLGENNPAFSAFSEQLAAKFLAQPAPISVGIPAFLGANYAFLWGMALVNPAMRRSFDDFNLAMLPGLVPQFPVKTFQYRILDSAQTRFAFDLGLDASKLMTAFNEGVLNTHVSSLKFDTGGKLDTKGPQPLALSSMQVQLGLFGDGVLLSGGFRNGISPYPLMGDDGSRVMAQTPALPDLFPNQRDVRFTLQLDLLKLAGHFGSPPPPPRRAPEQMQREASDTATVDAPTATSAVQSTLASAGAPLDAGTRGFMQSRFGHDFGRVRIHADAGADASARAVAAHAYTVGPHIAFASGRYAPHTAEGRRLLAHELAHVVQQGAGAKLTGMPPASPAERASSGHRATLMRQPSGKTATQRFFHYDRTQFDDRFDGEIDARNHRVDLVMRLDIEDMGAAEGKAERVQRFRQRAQEVIETTWSGRHALQSVCHGGGEKFEARVRVVMTSDSPHKTINLWPDAAGERSKSTEWQQSDTEAKTRETPVLIDPKKPATADNLRMASFEQTPVAHEFGHLMGVDHAVCPGNADRCYGITAEQKMDIMGYGSVVSQRDYAPFVRILQRYGQDHLPAGCNTWHTVSPG
jgi:hypothetical protein